MTVALGTNIANPISTALSQWPGFDTMGKLANYGILGVTDPDAVIKALFASGEQGAWYDPSDLTTMFQDRAGTTLVTADGQTVGKILDKSGRGNHATALNDAARPLYKTSGGLHWLQFDGVNNRLATAVIDKSAWAGAICVIGHISNSGTGGVMKGADSAVNNNHTPYGLDQWYCAFGSGTRYGPFAPMAYLTKYVTTRSRDATTSRFRVNASEVGSGAAATNFGGSSIIAFGSGDTSFGVGPIDGNIYSLVLRADLSTTQEITDTETWVNGKTGAY